MSWRRSARHGAGRGIGIMVLILGLVHTPLPQPDFHNIRHHDSPGEVCEHHDHLLRWHPGAGIADDVAVLHWHWFLPTVEPFDATPEQAGPAIHAHVVDWQASTWEDGPRVSADTTSRVVAALAASTGLASLMLPSRVNTAELAPGAWRVRAFSATSARPTPLTCLFERWDC
jgi:hypothetical protein